MNYSQFLGQVDMVLSEAGYPETSTAWDALTNGWDACQTFEQYDATMNEWDFAMRAAEGAMFYLPDPLAFDDDEPDESFLYPVRDVTNEMTRVDVTHVMIALGYIRVGVPQ